MRKDGIADELFLLQLADDRPVIGFRVALLLADRRGDRLHLFLDLVEGAVRHPRQVRRRDVDAELFEVARIERRREFEVRSRARHDVGTHRFLVRGELRLQCRQVRCRIGHVVLLEQLVQAAGEEADIAEIAIDLVLERPEQFLLSKPLAHALHGELGERLEARLGAGVLPQARQRRPAPLLRHLVVEQRAQTVEDGLRRVDVRQQQLLGDVEAVPLLSDGFDEDLEVLANQRVLLGAETPLQFLLHAVQALLRARRKTRAEIGDPVVEPVETELGGPLRRKPRLFLEHDTRVLVAAFHPVRRRSLGGGLGSETRPAARQPCRRRSRASATTARLKRRISGVMR